MPLGRLPREADHRCPHQQRNGEQHGSRRARHTANGSLSGSVLRGYCCAHTVDTP